MISWRAWLFRTFLIAIIMLMFVSFAKPWWTTDIDVLTNEAIKIYGFGIPSVLGDLSNYIQTDKTPFYQIVIAWIYLVSSMAIALMSTWVKGIRGKLMLGGVGLAYLLYALVAIFVVVSNRLDDFNIPLQGTTLLTMEYFNVSIVSNLRFSFYLACASGILFIILAFFRDSITGEKIGKNNTTEIIILQEVVI